MSRSELPPHLYESYMSRSELGLDLHEGFTIQGLPIIPPASLPAEIPVLADCSSHLRAAPLAERAVETIDSYHQGLKLVVQPGDPEVWKASAEVVGQTMKINEVVKKAYEEASELTIELVKRVESFNESVLIRASHFTNGQWLLLTPQLLRQKLKAYTIPDPEAFVQDVRHSLQDVDLDRQLRPRTTSQNREGEMMPSMIRQVVEKLLTVEDGRRLAFELCFTIKLDGTIMDFRPYTGTGSDAMSLLRNKKLDACILELIRGPGFCDEWSGVPSWISEDSTELIEPAAARRRLWADVQAKGCQVLAGETGFTHFDSSNQRHNAGPWEDDCSCHRRASLYLLQELQKRAYGSIRAKVASTIGQIVPADVFELLFEFLEPGFGDGHFQWRAEYGGRQSDSRRHQQGIRREYRCPQYRQGIKDGAHVAHGEWFPFEGRK